MVRPGSHTDKLYKRLAEAVSLSRQRMQDFVLQFNIPYTEKRRPSEGLKVSGEIHRNQ